MKIKNLALIAVICLMSSAAFAWPPCSGNWVSVPSGTKGTASSGIGAVVTENGQTFQCQNPTPPSNPSSNSSSSTATSSSNSSSNSSASSNQNQGQQQGQQQGQNQTANGGSASATGGSSKSTSTATGGSVSGSGNSTVGVNNTIGPVSSTSGVKNSGNSSNTNNNTAQGGAGGAGGNATATGGQGGAGGSSNQQQSNSSTNNNASSANGNGDNSNNYSNTTNYKAADIPVNTAVGTSIIPGNPCYKTYGGGVQTQAFGISGGGGKIDGGCDAREYARYYAELLHSRVAACKMLVTQKRSKKAGVTFEDCMTVDAQPAPVAAPPLPPVEEKQPTIIVVPVQTAANPVAAPQVAVPVTPVVEQLIGVCTFASKTQCQTPGSDAVIVDPTRPTSVCKEMLSAAVKALKRNPGSVIILRGNRNPSESPVTAVSRAYRVQKQLETEGVKASQIKTETGTGDARTVEIILAPQS